MPNFIAKPRLVDTKRGFSVYYNERYLFSKYDPQKSFTTLVNNTLILNNSLIICVSPVLQFPIDILLQKLEREHCNNCFILAIEKNNDLYNFFTENMVTHSNVAIANISSEYDITLLLENKNHCKYVGSKIPPLAQFKRLIVFDASSEATVHRDFYARSIQIAQNSITQFWKNRATLMKLGKLFSKNTIKNVKKLKNTSFFPHKTVSKPILVVGAGTSLDSLIPFIKEYEQSFYILAIAAAMRPLLDNDITPDAIVTVEAQYATERAFIGTKNKRIPLFADLVSRPSILNILKGETYFYVSEYTKSPLLNRIKEFFPQLPLIDPLGSVGLTCTEIACMIRQNSSVPICVCGLDFSYIAGKSHCNESPHIKYALQYSHRFSPFGNVGAAYSYGSEHVIGKNNQHVATDKALKGYGDLFSARYKNVKNLFDISSFGLVNELPQSSIDDVINLLNRNRSELNSTELTMLPCYEDATIDSFYKNETSLLESIKNVLIGKKTVDQKELLSLIDSCNYLYTHFPDGHECATLRQDFLNRIRFEVDYFLKGIS